MNLCTLPIMAALVLAAPPLRAQTMAGHEQRRLDPARRELQRGLLVLRDSVAASSGGIARLQRNLTGRYDGGLIAAARGVSAACAAAERTAVRVREAAQAGTYVEPHHRTAVERFIPSLDSLAGALRACLQEFDTASPSGGGQAPALRRDGALRGERLRQRLLTYDRRARETARRLEIRLVPENRTLGPLDG